MDNLEDQVNDAVEVMDDLRETDIEKPMKPMALEAAVERKVLMICILIASPVPPPYVKCKGCVSEPM